MTKLIRHRFKTYEEFLVIRAKLTGKGTKDVFRLGASDIASVYSNGVKLGLNDYVSPTVFFYQACDYVEKYPEDSLVMLRGHIQERTIHDEYWKYVDPTDPSKEAFLNNWYGEKYVFRTATRANQIVENTDYPWLFITPDYNIQKNEFTPAGPLELKSPSSRAIEKYEANVPTSYVIQVQGQQLVLGAKYGELFMVVDSTYPVLMPFEKSEIIHKNIIASTKDFHDRVIAGKKIVYSRRSKLYKEQALAELAPPDDGHELYTEYLKEKHRPENSKLVLEGENDQLDVVIKYLRLKRSAKGQKTRILKLENQIREWFTEDVGAIDFPGLGKIGWIEKFTVSDKILKNFNLLEV